MPTTPRPVGTATRLPYCGVADDGKKTYAIVAQLSRRKPALKKPLSNDGVLEDAAPTLPARRRYGSEARRESALNQRAAPRKHSRSAGMWWIW
jgi:hypothetical protein